MKKIILIIILFCTSTLESLACSSAERYYWDGDTNSEWDVSDNWGTTKPGKTSNKPQAYYIRNAAGTIGSEDIAYFNSSHSANYDIDFIEVYRDGTLIIENRTLNLQYGLQIRTGGKLIIGTGAKVTADDIRLLDSDSEIIIRDGGKLTINNNINVGAFGVDDNQDYILNEGGSGNPTIHVINGTLSCKNLAFTNETEDDGYVIIENSGIVSVSGNITNVADVNDLASITINDSGKLNVTGNIDFKNQGDIINITNSGSITIDGNYSNEGQSKIGTGTFTSKGNWTSGNTVSLSGGAIEVKGNFTNSANINMTSGNLQVAGHWTNSGNGNITGGTVSFNGTSSQFIVNTATLTVSILNQKNSSGITLTNDIAITNRLYFTAGKINGNVIFHDNAGHSNYTSTTKYINGKVTKIGNDAFTFPLYLSASITAPGDVTDEFTGRYFSTSALASYPPSANDHSTITSASTREFWLINHTVQASNNNINVDLEWNAASSVGTLDEVKVIKYDGAKWIDLDAESYTGTSSAGKITSIGINEFSPFTFGSGTIPSILPVTLINFDIEAENEIANINWKTTQEKNNDYFVVEKSKDLNQWSDMIQVKGKGSTDEIISYHTIDNKIFDGISYYRLRQVDFDGTIAYSDIITLDKKDGKTNDFKWTSQYPNPFNDIINIDYSEGFTENALCKIFDSRGKLMYSSKSGEHPSVIHTDNFQSGVYYLEVIDGIHYKVTKMIKQ